MKYHFIGIKGAGMSSLACVLNDYGFEVQGSDVLEYFFTEDKLNLRNIKVLPFNKDNIKTDMIVIIGNAFLDNDEHQEAKKLGCEIHTYNEYIGVLSKKFFSIAVSGSHGKTSTTNLIRQILETKGKVNYLVGDGQGGGNQDSDIFVFEACEYKRHFLKYYPKVLVITNIDFDHPDYYHDIKDVQRAFSEFVVQSKSVVYNGDDPFSKEIIPDEMEKVSFGLNPLNDYRAENISNDNRFTYFDLYIKSKFLCKIKIPLFGMHSVYNTLSAIATTHMLVNDLELIKEALSTYIPSKRRFEETLINNQIIISDYAHHPKEIKATIEAISLKYHFKKIIVYFQPHTYTRTISFLSDFGDSLSLADKVYLREIFSSAREHQKSISVNDLSNLIPNSEVINDDRYLEIFKSYQNAVIVFMGAGDIDQNCAKYIKNLKNI